MRTNCVTICHRSATAIWNLAAAVAVATFFVASMSAPAWSQAPADFYKGKNLNIVIGYSVGGGYDAYARLLAVHLGKHIPGNPTVVPQNMVGAGSLKAALYLDTVAPKDGTVIATFGRNIPIDPLMATTGAASLTAGSLTGSAASPPTSASAFRGTPRRSRSGTIC